MHVDWAALLNVGVTTIVGAAVLVTIFAVGARAGIGAAQRRADGRSAVWPATLAGCCLLAVTAIVATGLWLLVPFLGG